MTGLASSWLAASRGLDPVRIERLRAAGEIHAVREPDGWRFPGWQFDERGEVLPAARRLLALATAHRADAATVAAVLERRVGLVGGSTVRDLLLNGGESRALAEAERAFAHTHHERS